MADIEGADILAIDTLGEVAAAVPVLAEDGAAAVPDLPPGAARQDDGSVTYALRHPCAIRYRRVSDGATREESIASLHLHRLTGGDMRAITAASADMMTVVAIARSARINEARMKLIFDAMDAEDAAACGEVVSSFFGDWPADWPLILAAIGGHYGWPRADLESLTWAEALFWNNAAAEYLKRLQPE